MIKKIRHKSAVRDGIQWTGKNLQEVIEFAGQDNVGPIERRPDYKLKIRRFDMGNSFDPIEVGDWILKGLTGVLLIVPGGVFDDLYEFVS